MKGQKRAERLTPRLKPLYAALIELERKLGAPPTIRELVARLNLTADHISRVHGDLEALVELGLAERLPIPTRTIKANGPPPEEIDWEELLSRD